MDTNIKTYSIQPNCPWYQAQQSYGPPNVKYCEPTQCAWINEPSNTWSNLSYILFAVMIAKKINTHNEKPIRDFAVAVFFTGLFSFTYHATNNFFTQFFDFLGMYMATSVPLALQTQRIRGKNPRDYYAFYWFYLLVSTLMFWCFQLSQLPVQFTIVVQIVAIIALEFYCKIKEGKRLNMKWFYITMAIFAVGEAFSIIDLKRIWCEPENTILFGHAIWHVLGGLGFFTLAIHYREFLKTSAKD